MVRPKPKRLGDPNRHKALGHAKVHSETLRAARLERKTPEGQADRAVSYDPRAVRAAIEAQICPVCGRGPYKVLAVHTCKAHGIDRRELREMAGLTMSASICAPEFSDRARELAAQRGFGAMGAAVDRSTRPVSYRMTTAGREAVSRNLRNYMDELSPEEANHQRRHAARIAAEQRTERARERKSTAPGVSSPPTPRARP